MELERTQAEIKQYRILGLPMLLLTTTMLLGSVLSLLRASVLSQANDLNFVFANILVGKLMDKGWFNFWCNLSPQPAADPLVSFHNIYFLAALLGFAFSIYVLKVAKDLDTEIKEERGNVRKEKLRDDIRKNT